MSNTYLKLRSGFYCRCWHSNLLKIFKEISCFIEALKVTHNGRKRAKVSLFKKIPIRTNVKIYFKI